MSLSHESNIYERKAAAVNARGNIEKEIDVKRAARKYQDAASAACSLAACKCIPVCVRVFVCVCEPINVCPPMHTLLCNFCYAMLANAIHSQNIPMPAKSSSQLVGWFLVNCEFAKGHLAAYAHAHLRIFVCMYTCMYV